MLEPPARVQSFPAYLAERRARLAEQLARQATPVEAMHAARETLDELLTLDLSQRSARERQIGERAVRIVWDALGCLQAVRAEAHWPHPVGGRRGRPGLPWRLLGLIAVQLMLTGGVVLLLTGALQRGTAGGDEGVTFGMVLLVGLLALQALTGYQLVVRPRASQTAADARPRIALRVDADDLLATLSQALLAVDRLEQAAVPPEPATPARATLADYPELLRAVQLVYAARLSDDPERVRGRVEALRASLEQYGVDLCDEWPGDEPPPPELFVTQRSLDPSSREYRVILPAVVDARGAIVPGRVAVPADWLEAGSARRPLPDRTERPAR